ncbi:glycerate kinase [Eubacterium sp. AF18-3]|nr:glycerate kinase [Eubacterium sp. AF18-3]
MKIVIAIDSFKGATSSIQAGTAIEKGIKKYHADKTLVIPVGDGGENSLQALAHALSDYEWIWYSCKNAFFEDSKVAVLSFYDNGKKTCAIETAAIFGLHDKKVSRDTVKQTSTFGLGTLLKQLQMDDYKKIIIFIGGTITTDGGLGMLQGLGVRLHDKDHRELSLTENPLLKIKTFDQNSLDTVLKQFADVEIAVGCDVDAPLYGEKGAAVMFARQKGVQDDQIIFLDNQLQLVAKLLKRDLKQPYYGAGGGIAAALSLFATSVSSGFTLLNTYLHIEDKMKDMDLVITGEGRMDEQSLQGKLPVCIASIAKQMQVPVIAVCGQKKGEVSSFDTYFNGVFSIQPGVVTLLDAITNTEKNLEEFSYQLMRSLHAIHHFRLLK